MAFPRDPESPVLRAGVNRSVEVGLSKGLSRPRSAGFGASGFSPGFHREPDPIDPNSEP